VFVQAKHALLEAGQQGLRPASDAPDEIHDFVRQPLKSVTACARNSKPRRKIP